MEALEFQQTVIDQAKKVNADHAGLGSDNFDYTGICATVSLNTDRYLESDNNENIYSKLRTLEQTKLTLSLYEHRLGPLPALNLYRFYEDYLQIEIDRIRRCLDNPTMLKAFTPKRITPYKWIANTQSFMEYVCLMYYSDCVRQIGASNLSFVRFSRDMAGFYNVHIDDPYKIRSSIANRKKNLTPFADMTRNKFIDNIRLVGIR